MFGISFSELLLVGMIALLVLGPERLPGAARTAGLWIGRARRSFNSIKMQVEREMGSNDVLHHLPAGERATDSRPPGTAPNPPSDSPEAPRTR